MRATQVVVLSLMPTLFAVFSTQSHDVRISSEADFLRCSGSSRRAIQPSAATCDHCPCPHSSGASVRSRLGRLSRL